MTIAEIIERLEKATGPDRWIDAKIDAAFRVGSKKMQGDPGFDWAWKNFPVWAHHKQARGMCGVQHENGDLGLIWDSERFTGSLDAAVALCERVLPGSELELTNLYGVARVTIHNAGDTGPFYGADQCNNMPVALCIAILKAKRIPVESKRERA